jgi:hypothetical protein
MNLAAGFYADTIKREEHSVHQAFWWEDLEKK